MNGRALNEKAIEVSPSSSRVLDRAAEILTPFPPSKNRPRPGDWTCPSCGFSNFQRRTACFRCSYPAVSAAPGGENVYGGYGYSQASILPPQPPSMGHGPGGHGMPSRGMPSGGGIVPFRAGDWKCGSEGCGYHNFAKNVSCLRCGASRAGAAVVADTAFSSPIDAPSPYTQQGAQFGAGPMNAHLGGNQGFPGQQFAQQQNAFGLPSGIGGGVGGGFPPMNTGMGGHGGAQFDQRNDNHQYSASGNVVPNGGLYSGLPGEEAFSFLSTGLGGLALGDDGRRKDLNGGAPSRSPAV